MRVPKEVTREREMRAWELRQKLWTQERIALELGITQAGVSKMLLRLNKRYLEQITEQIDAYKAEQVAQLSHIADEAMQSWQQSKQPEKAVSQVKATGKGRGAFGKGDDGRVTTQVKEKSGDPRFLSAAMTAMADIRKILALDAPIHLDHTSKGEQVGSGEEALRAINEGRQRLIERIDRLADAIAKEESSSGADE